MKTIVYLATMLCLLSSYAHAFGVSDKRFSVFVSVSSSNVRLKNTINELISERLKFIEDVELSNYENDRSITIVAKEIAIDVSESLLTVAVVFSQKVNMSEYKEYFRPTEKGTAELYDAIFSISSSDIDKVVLYTADSADLYDVCKEIVDDFEETSLAKIRDAMISVGM